MNLSVSARKIVVAAELLFSSYRVAIEPTLLATLGPLARTGEALAGGRRRDRALPEANADYDNGICTLQD